MKFNKFCKSISRTPNKMKFKNEEKPMKVGWQFLFMVVFLVHEQKCESCSYFGSFANHEYIS